MARDPIKALAQIEDKLEGRTARILLQNANKIKMKLRAVQPLKPRTGRRQFPYLTRVYSELAGGRPVAEVYTPVPWGHVHIGPMGSITPVQAKVGFMALPTEFAKRLRTKAVRVGRYTGLQIFAGIVWGKAGWHGSAGIRERRAAGEKMGKDKLIPLYILKKRIKIKRRINPEVYVRWIRPQLIKELQGIIKP